MEFFKKLFGGKDSEISLTEKELVEASACPNCWGKQEYANQFKEYMMDLTKSNINKDKQGKKAFVQQFVETHLTGIRLKKDGDQLVCLQCEGKYKTVSSKTN